MKNIYPPLRIRRWDHPTDTRPLDPGRSTGEARQKTPQPSSAKPRLRLAPAAEEQDAAQSRAVLTDLLRTASARAAELTRQVERSVMETVWTLANVIDARDNRTAGHSQRVAWLARLTGEALGLEEDDLWTLECAGALHDVGKLGVAERILNKPGPLTPVERAQVQQHPWLGCEVLRPVSGLRDVLDAILYHHENHDGSGYSDGLAGDEIPLFARILHVVDIFDALISDRPYRRGMPLEDALAELERGAGSITDPGITQLFIAAIQEVRSLQPEEFDRRFPQALVPATR